MTWVVCAQVAPRVGDLATNAAATVEVIHAAVASGAKLVVLPELSTSGYVFASVEEATATALTVDDPLFDAWADEARRGDAIVVGGFCERGRDGLLYNSAAIVDGAGVRAIYRKTHLWDRETLFFEFGDEAPPVVETPFGRIGVLVCYDLEFPELTRDLALRGADLIAVPTNWPLVERPHGECPPEVVIAMAAARINRVHIACCDRTGTERGQRWTEGTTIVGADGWVVATCDASGFARADLDLATARRKTLSQHNDALADRRPELYGSLLETREVTR